MAPKKEKKTPIDVDSIEVPEGFQKVSNEQSNAWIEKIEGATVEGELLGRFQLKKAGKDGKIRSYYQVKLYKPAQVSRKVEDETTTEEATEGEIVNVDESAATQCLAIHVAAGKRVSVWLRYVEKIDIGDGQTFWRIVVGVKPITE